MNNNLMPALIVHADWGSSESKRWMARARLQPDGTYIAFGPELVGELGDLLTRLLAEARGGSVLAGFDFPIGLPHRYAADAGITEFLSALPLLGTGEWNSFYTLAKTPEQITIHRPFYPYRPGNTRQEHLLKGLRVGTIQDLMRCCEIAAGASPLFWTLGAKQVGRAAIIGWRDVLAPALRSSSPTIRLWPFHGRLRDLLAPNHVVIVETYPAAFCRHLGIGGVVKSDQQSRMQAASTLLSWSKTNRVELDHGLREAILDGFSRDFGDDDGFDAAVGLFGMLNVVLGNRPEGSPPEHLRMMEGWILGQGSER